MQTSERFYLPNEIPWRQLFKGIPDRFLILLSNTENKFSLNIENNIIENSDTLKHPGIMIDNELKFDKHVENLCKKTCQKLHALARISKYYV